MLKSSAGKIKYNRRTRTGFMTALRNQVVQEGDAVVRCSD